MMEVDLLDEFEPTIQKSTSKRPPTVTVDDAHPFDLEPYISSYDGMWELRVPNEMVDMTFHSLYR